MVSGNLKEEKPADKDVSKLVGQVQKNGFTFILKTEKAINDRPVFMFEHFKIHSLNNRHRVPAAFNFQRREIQ